MKLGDNDFTRLIQQSAALRGSGRFQDAINLIDANIPLMEEDCFENAYLEAFYAASQGGLTDVALKYAKLLQAIDPEIPTVAKFLADQRP